MPGRIGTWDRFKLGAHGASIFHSKIKIAVVYRREELNLFAETVGVNRGMRTRVFSEMETALEWLDAVK